MMLRILGLAFVVLLAPRSAWSQPLFDNPFGDAAYYRAERGATAPATLRLTYETTVTRGREAPKVAPLIVDIGPDWSLVSDGGQTMLMDFRLNRSFTLYGDRFKTANGLWVLMFRVLERQNRAYLQAIFDKLPPKAPRIDACDIDAELGISLGAGKVSPKVAPEGRTTTATCGGRVVGSVTSGKETPPAAFWPTMNNVMLIHPVLFKVARSSGAAPERVLTIRRVMAAGREDSTVWRLVAAERISTPYPLTGTMENVTAATLDSAVGPGVGTLAAQAVAGRTKGGAPTAESWARDLQVIYDTDGAAALAMALLPTFNMFPQVTGLCAGDSKEPICRAINTGRSVLSQEAAPRALIAIAQAEQRGDNAAAIAAMKTAQATPLRDHPALGASYALAMLKFNPAALDSAKAAGLPTDGRRMRLRAVEAYPYNPAYWLDIADAFASDYDLQTTTLLYDVALSLPMPAALTGNPAVRAKRELLGRIRADFPDASMTAP